MNGDPPALFRGRHFVDDVIVLCVRWYLRYSLSYRDLTEMMSERHLSVDPSTIWKWVQCYAPELNARIRRESNRQMGLGERTIHMCESRDAEPMYIERWTLQAQRL